MVEAGTGLIALPRLPILPAVLPQVGDRPLPDLVEDFRQQLNRRQLELVTEARTAGQGYVGVKKILATDNLHTLAAAGGTERALFVDPSADVSEQFLQALGEIRSGSLGCEYLVPDPPDRIGLDYQRVNVSFTEGAATTNLFYVESAAGCDRAKFGWYYDVAPTGDTTPNKILICDSTCSRFENAMDAQVDIRLAAKPCGRTELADAFDERGSATSEFFPSKGSCTRPAHRHAAPACGFSLHLTRRVAPARGLVLR